MTRAFILILISLICVEHTIAQQSKNAALSAQLRAIHEADQRYRYILNDWEQYSQKQKDSIASSLKLHVARVVSTLWQRQDELDKQNLAAVKKIIAAHGYPGKSLVGDTASLATWYVLQHSREAQTYFPMIQTAGHKGELPRHLVAQMQDRLLTNKNKPQLYGTQAAPMNLYDSATRQYTLQMVIWPVEDAANLEQRRKDAGFEESIQDVAKRLNARYIPQLTIKQLEESRKVVLEDNDEDITPEMKRKGRAAIAIKLPGADMEGSTFRHMQMADSFSKTGNFRMAEHYFMQISPYQLFYLDYTPATITKLYNKFRLSDSARLKYGQQFITAYANTQKPAYDSFRKFYSNIRALKSRYDTARGAAKKSIERQLVLADTAHAGFLLRYIGRHGWPTLEEGSLYASYLAGRHYNQWYNYLPAMHEAFFKKQVQYSHFRKVRDNERRSIDHRKYQKAILSNAFEWDFSSCLVGELPYQGEISALLDQAKASCPHYQIYFVISYPGNLANWTNKWLFSNTISGKFDRQYWDFLATLFDACPELYDVSRKSISYYYIPSERKEESLKLYIVPTKHK